MNRRDLLRSAAALTVAGFPLGWTAGQDKATKKILMFTRSQGFEHSVIKRSSPDKLGHAEQILTDLGAKNGFEVTCTKDGRVFLPETIAKYDAFFFYTTGDLTKEGGDKNPPCRPKARPRCSRPSPTARASSPLTAAATRSIRRATAS
jgi:hypothetical protein